MPPGTVSRTSPRRASRISQAGLSLMRRAAVSLTSPWPGSPPTPGSASRRSGRVVRSRTRPALVSRPRLGTVSSTSPGQGCRTRRAVASRSHPGTVSRTSLGQGSRISPSHSRYTSLRRDDRAVSLMRRAMISPTSPALDSRTRRDRGSRTRRGTGSPTRLGPCRLTGRVSVSRMAWGMGTRAVGRPVRRCIRRR